MTRAARQVPDRGLDDLLADFLEDLAGGNYSKVLKRREQVLARCHFVGTETTQTIRKGVIAATDVLAVRNLCHGDRRELWATALTAIEGSLEGELAALMRGDLA